MVLKRYHNREWTTFNWQLPVDFITSSDPVGSKHQIVGNLRQMIKWVASILPRQVPKMELGIGYMSSNDDQLESEN